VPEFCVTLSFKERPNDDQRAEQREFLRGMHDAGDLLLAAKFADAGGGGMAVLAAASLDEAREKYAASPLVRHGLVDTDIRPIEVTWGELHP
jgi:uncharacterized protein YciI